MAGLRTSVRGGLNAVRPCRQTVEPPANARTLGPADQQRPRPMAAEDGVWSRGGEEERGRCRDQFIKVGYLLDVRNYG